MMKYLSIIIIALLSGCSSADKPINEKVENELKGLLKLHKDCEYGFSVLIVGDSTGDTREVGYVSDIGSSWNESTIVKYCVSNKKEVYPILNKMLTNGEYEWTCNLLLYRITGEPADSLERFEPDKCVEWNSERKQKDISFWKNHKIDWKKYNSIYPVK